MGLLLQIKMFRLLAHFESTIQRTVIHSFVWFRLLNNITNKNNWHCCTHFYVIVLMFFLHFGEKNDCLSCSTRWKFTKPHQGFSFLWTSAWLPKTSGWEKCFIFCFPFFLTHVFFWDTVFFYIICSFMLICISGVKVFWS